MTRTRQETLGMRWNKGVLTVEDGWCSLTWGKLKQQNDRLPTEAERESASRARASRSTWPGRPLRLIIRYYVSNRKAEKPLGSYVSGFSSFWSPWEKSQEEVLMRPNFINAAARLQSSGWGTAARLARVITSDKSVLCERWEGRKDERDTDHHEPRRNHTRMRVTDEPYQVKKVHPIALQRGQSEMGQGLLFEPDCVLGAGQGDVGRRT